ncbi:MAG: S8 family serine peptidase [Candidatus Heimdallarchaeota archaeon]
MKKFVKKGNLLILGYIIFFSLIIPNISYGFNLNDERDIDADFDYRIDSELLSSLGKSNQEAHQTDLQTDALRQIYDQSLYDFLDSLSPSEQIQKKKVEVIALFSRDVSKDERLNIINSIFEDYKILNNYNVIPGISFVCNTLELLDKALIINSFTNIQRIYKSKTFQSPAIIGENPKTSQLDPNLYTNWWLSAVGADNLPYDGSGVKVAVIDTGIYNHPDLNIISNRNFVYDEDEGRDPSAYYDGNGHGTHVAGIISSSGVGSNGEYRGIAPGVSLINAKAGEISGGLEEADIILAIEWCIETAKPDIISMSFGDVIPNVYDPITLALSNATNRGIICVASAGNSGPGYFTGGSPATGVDVISVGATDRYNNLVSFSSWGPSTTYIGYPDVVAPGVNIISTEAPGSVISDRMRLLGDYFDFIGNADYLPLSGTSMSCPIVSGALAILKQAYPHLTPEAARIAILEGTTKLGTDDESLKFGAGLINVSASLDFLNNLNINYGNVNNSVKIFPNELPVKPFDMLNFPGDHQSFNLTILSGEADDYNITIPNNVDGVSVSIDKSQISFSDAGINFVNLDIEINSDAEPGPRNFQLNLTQDMNLLDNVDISVVVKLPEYKILMDSYHGLNDWFPEYSFYQADFYDAMKDISNLNISIDYKAEFWSPNYDAHTDNSLLTEEGLAQYDLVVLQSPLLPYSPIEISNIKNYYDNGGNILFLGTRYQDLCIDSINDLFSKLGADFIINEENIYNEAWIGVGSIVDSQDVSDLNSISLFNGVNNFKWLFGTTFTTQGDSQSIARLNGKTVAALYDGSSIDPAKGRILAFGDLHWLTDYYLNSYSDHSTLLNNILNYFISQNNVSINIGLESERISDSQLNISVYIKDQILDKAIDSSILNTFLNVSIENSTYFESIDMISSKDGISSNFTYSLPSSSSTPYIIKVNFTYGSIIYNKSSKILYFDSSEMPIINTFSVSPDVTRTGTDSLNILTTLNNIGYNTEAFLSLHSYSFFNYKKTVNRTISLSGGGLLKSGNYYPDTNDPSGFGIIYLIPTNPSTNYYYSESPRLISRIINHNPEIDEQNSKITIGSETFTFEDTHDLDDNPYVIPVSQGNIIDFEVHVSDSVLYEDSNSSNMRVLISLFICSVNYQYLIPIEPKVVPAMELYYQSLGDRHEGRFTVPKEISYSTITGTQSVPTITGTQYDPNNNREYLGLLIITALDSDGGFQDFSIVLQINRSLDWVLILIIISVIAAIGIATMILLLRRKSKISKEAEYMRPEYYERPTEEVWEADRTANFYCPYCGFQLGVPQNFCPNCGKSLYFEE